MKNYFFLFAGWGQRSETHRFINILWVLIRYTHPVIKNISYLENEKIFI